MSIANSAAVPVHEAARRLPLLAAMAFFAVYVAVDWVSFVHPMRGLNITPWNPQAGLAVALLVAWPRAGWLVWLAIAVSELLVRPEGLAIAVPIAAGLALTAGYAATAAGLARWPSRASAMTGRRQVAMFLAVVAAGALAASLLRVLVLALLDVSEADRLVTAVHRGWVSDFVGMLVALPLLHVLGQREGRARSKAMARTVEWWLLVLIALAATVVLFARPPEEQFKFFYLLFVPVVWAAARFGLPGAAWSIVLVQLLLIVAVESAEFRPLTVFELQLLMAVLAGTGLLLGGTVDEREEAQRVLRTSQRQAAAGDMAAALAHELNQPLAALSTYARAAQFMAQRLGEIESANAETLVDVSGKLVQEAGRASDIVRRLRDFFRERTTQLSLAHLPQLVDDVLQSQAAHAQAIGLRLEGVCEPGVPPLWIDAVQIGVVLRNFVANAIDAAASARENAEEPMVKVHARIEDDEVIVSVHDSGPGLAAHQVASVFESRLSGKPGGMGVGLGISRTIVEAHGGRVWAEEGPGGHFHFSLPAGGRARTS